MTWLARGRRARLDRKIAHAQDKLQAAIARGDQRADDAWAKRITRLMAKHR